MAAAWQLPVLLSWAMTEWYRTERAPGSVDERGASQTLFAQTMGLVAATAGFFALGAYVARDLDAGWSLALWIASLACLVAMSFAARASEGITVGLLFAFGFLLGTAAAPTLVYLVSADPDVLWQAAVATALFVAGFGVAGYSTRRDLAPLARVLLWALTGLIVFGVVLVFVELPGGSVVYALLGLVIFAGYVMVDFQRLRSGREIESAPLLAASIFLDILNVFEFFVTLFARRD
jgi:modulator of FtsH protease